MRFSTATVLSALVALATAYTQPNYSKPPKGNPISSPGLNEQVPEGKPLTITWKPTTKGDVSLVLLRGPSSNVKPLETIVEQIPNSGSYVWTPGTNLTPDTTHYGLLLVVEGTGQYQWSTQFGISAPAGSHPGDDSVPIIESTTSSTPESTTTSSTTTSTTTSQSRTTTSSTAKSTTSSSSSTTTTTTTTTAAVTTATVPPALATTTIKTVVVPNLSKTPAQSTTVRATTSPSTRPASPSTAPLNAAGRNAVSVGAAAVAGMVAFAMAF